MYRASLWRPSPGLPCPAGGVGPRIGVALLAACIAGVGCLDGPPPRGSPLAPGFTDPRFDSAIVFIVAPGDGDLVSRAELGVPPGLEIHYDGEYVPGHLLQLQVSPEGSPQTALGVTRIPILSSEPGERVGHVAADPSRLLQVFRIRIQLRVLDDTNRLLSVDSVDVILR